MNLTYIIRCIRFFSPFLRLRVFVPEHMQAHHVEGIDQQPGTRIRRVVRIQEQVPVVDNSTALRRTARICISAWYGCLLIHAGDKCCHCLRDAVCPAESADAPLPLQETFFERQARLADEAGKPLVIHLVKAVDELLRARRRLVPRVPWVIHGFRGKAPLAQELLRHGFYLSFGERFQEAALAAVPLSRLFIETDESPLPVADIYARAARARRMPLEELAEAVRANVQSVFLP